MNTLQTAIMRRVYYAFFVRTVTQPALLIGFFMLAMLILLTYFVSLGNVIHNLQSVHVSGFSSFVMNAFLNTEAWTLLILGILIFAAFSLRFTLLPANQELKFVKV